MEKEHPIPFVGGRIGRYVLLLVSILLLFLLRPFFEGRIGMAMLLDFIFSFILLSAIYAASEKRYLFFVSLCVALPPLVLRWTVHFVESPTLALLTDILMVAFAAYILTIVLSHVFRQHEVTTDLIMGAVCGYFFIGLMWAFVYTLLESVQAGSFRFGEGQAQDISHFIYYSFVTQTTLGYGDIAPVSAPARSFAVLEAMIGQLYVAILIARLVGIHISQSPRRESQ
jgi:hypothetical protein